MPKIVQREALVGVARATGRRWRTYFVLAASVVIAAIAILFVPFASLRQGYSGLVLAVIALLVIISLVSLESPAADPEVADGWSLAPLRKARGWWVIDKLPFDRDDVDHVVVAPAGVLAVETRYHPSTASADPTAAEERLQRELRSAERSAHKVRLLMRAEQLRNAAPVVPVLIVWGPSAPTLPDGHELRNGVHLVDGAHPQRWMHLFAAPRVSLGLRRDLQARFEQFASRTAGIDARVMLSLRAEMWRELKTAIADERAQRASRTVNRSTRTMPAPGLLAVPAGDPVAAGSAQAQRTAC